MRVISCVPSWTETLLSSGIDVVGRTRFCIHPQDVISNIPIVGGTKNIDWQKVKALNADLLLLDKEENPKEFAENSPIPFYASHVTDLTSLHRELEHLSQLLKSDSLKALAEVNQQLLLHPPKVSLADFLKSSAVINFKIQNNFEFESVLYLIWKDPWMAVNSNTYIGSVLSYLNLNNTLKQNPIKYPEVKLEDYDFKKTLFLFSSEPYPFQKKGIPTTENLSYALVDGEKLSWFGQRGLQYLKEL